MAKASRKSPAKKSAKKVDRRGCPKGKATIAGGPGAKNGATASKGRIGNPPHVPTPELRRIAETHAAVGTPHWAIAAEMGISHRTLSLHYKEELELGLIRMNARVGSGIAKKALDGDSDMQKFWMARRGGPAWANKQNLEHSGPDGGPISHAVNHGLDLSKLSVDELRALKQLRAKAGADEPAES